MKVSAILICSDFYILHTYYIRKMTKHFSSLNYNFIWGLHQNALG